MGSQTKSNVVFDGHAYRFHIFHFAHLQSLLTYYGPVEHVTFFSLLCILNPNACKRAAKNNPHMRTT
jgi:hypothetical protein